MILPNSDRHTIIITVIETIPETKTIIFPVCRTYSQLNLMAQFQFNFFLLKIQFCLIATHTFTKCYYYYYLPHNNTIIKPNIVWEKRFGFFKKTLRKKFIQFNFLLPKIVFWLISYSNKYFF